jgi:hypothetical protein
VAEKLAHLQHEEWLAHRPKTSAALIGKALDILDHPSGHAPEDLDKIPDGCVSVRCKYAGKKASARRKA